MIRKLYFLLLLTIFSVPLYATHIVGYDMAMIHVGGTNYKFRFTWYRDCDPGSASGPPTRNFTIKRNSNNAAAPVSSVTFNVLSVTTLTYPLADCPPSDLGCVERTILETPNIDMSAFTATGGYYIIASEGNRNAGITNLVNSNSLYISYVMEFPPVGLPAFAGQSSPIINKAPLAFYCIGKPYTIDWNITDPQNDSLVYSMTLPLDQGTTKPYTQIPYAPGFNVNYNIMDGVPDVTMGLDGKVNFLPTKLGVYQLAFLIQEFKRGASPQLKLGEIRREIQIEIKNCPAAPPATSGTHNETKTINDTIYVNDNAKRCIRFFTQDDPTDSLTVGIFPNYSIPGENVLAIGGDYGEIGHTTTTLQLEGVGSVSSEFCWKPQCSYVRDLPYRFQVIAHDNTCPTPFYDTTFVNIYVKARTNIAPRWVSPVTTNHATRQYFMNAGETFSFSGDTLIRVKDDNDPILTAQSIELRYENVNGDQELNSAVFYDTTGTLKASGRFVWPTQCSWARSEPYKLRFYAYDDDCADPDTIFFDVVIYLIPPPNELPIWDTSVTKAIYHVNQNDLLSFTVRAVDSLPFLVNRYELLTLSRDLSDFTSVVGGTIPSMPPVQMVSPASTLFQWTPNCANSRPEPYVLRCTIEDDACQVYPRKKDILIYVHGPVNSAPYFTTADLTAPIVIHAGETFTYQITSIDSSTGYDSLKLTAAGDIFTPAVMNPASLSPFPAYQLDSTKATITWVTDCSDIRTAPYLVEFYATDNACPTPAVDTFRIFIQVEQAPNDVPTFNPLITDITKTSFVLHPDTLLEINLASLDLQPGDGVVIDTVFSTIPLGFAIQPSFVMDSAQGGAQTVFSWNISCEHIRPQPYIIKFATYDNACRQFRDSTTYTISVLVQANPNHNPDFTSTIEPMYEVVAGEHFILNLTAENSFVGDSIRIVGSGDPFGGITGNLATLTQNTVGVVSTGVFDWKTSCDQIRPEPYLLKLQTYNPLCQTDTSTVNVVLMVIPNTDLNQGIPNVFTPNGDGYNDIYSINKTYKVYCDPGFRFSIFNRWGKKLFESTDPDFEWDGQDLGAGTYFYTITSKARTETGTINLIR